jgi:hypothetical protein
VGEADARTERLRALIAQGVEWPRAVAQARAHRLVPILADALRELTLDEAGEDARRRLGSEAKRIVYGNVFLAAELPGVIDRLAAEGIEAVPFKGPPLAMAAYASLALRPFDDLDLVVRWRDFGRAKAVLSRLGFRPSEDAWAAVRHLSHEQAFGAKEGRLQVDLHGRLFSREIGRVDLELLFSRLETIRVGEHALRSLRAEDLLLILCEHAHKHLWQRLLWLADLAHLVAARPGLDWSAALVLARASGGRRVLGVGLALAAELLDAPVPPAVLGELLRDPATAELRDEVRVRMFLRPPDEGFDFDSALSRLQWRSRERWRDRARLLVTPNESDWIVWPLPAPLSPAYYLLRPLRLVARYGFRFRRGSS